MAAKHSNGAPALVDVYVKLPSGRTIQMNMLPSDTVENIYQRIAEQESVSVDAVVIKYTGKVLKKSSTLGYLGVCAETILKAEILQKKMYSVYVRLPGGKSVSLEVENFSPVSYIQTQIQLQEEIATQKQILKLGDRRLNNMSQSLVKAGITNEAVITLEIKGESKGKKTTKTKSGRRGSQDSTGSGDSITTTDDEDAAAKGQETEDMMEADKEAVLSTFDADGKNVEVVFSFDTTGSMYSCLSKVRQKLKETVERLLQNISSIRIGIIAHGDYCDHSNYVLKMVDLTSDVEELVQFVEGVPATGGGDAPECYEWVLCKAVHMDWSEDSAKALVVIGDCRPHEVTYTDQSINWHEQLDLLKGMGVKVYGVKALNQQDSLPFYKELADRTGGAYITFQNMSIISEMFMAVCYREASEEQLEAFCEQMDKDQEDIQANSDNPREKTKAKDIKDVLTQLKNQTGKQAEDESKRYIAQAWWDPQLVGGKPQYSYDPATDRWSRHTTDTHTVKRTASLHTTVTPVAKTKSKRTFSLRIKSPRSPSSGTSGSGITPMKKVGKKSGCSVM